MKLMYKFHEYNTIKTLNSIFTNLGISKRTTRAGTSLSSATQ